jgi:transcriptional regulator with XRE-family HTH domain
MFRGVKPQIYVAVPLTGHDKGMQKHLQSLFASIATVANEEGYAVHAPWTLDALKDPLDKPMEEVYQDERAQLLSSDLLMAAERPIASGVGRLLEIAEQNLIDIIYIRSATSQAVRVAGSRSIKTAPIEVSEDDPESLRVFLKRNYERLSFRRATWPQRNVPSQCAARIKAIRKEVSVTRDSLAKKLGVSRVYIEMIEDGRIVPSLYSLRVLASGLGVPLSSLSHVPESDSAAMTATAKRQKNPRSSYPLRGSVLRYEDPMLPVADDTWDVLQ